MRIDVVTPPASEPLTLAEAKLHLRVVHSSDDTLITAQAIAAREYVERVIGYGLITQTLRATLDTFPCVIKLEGPVTAITSIKYTDKDGVEQTLAPSAYAVDLSGGGARITPVYSTSWPTTRSEPAAVRVVYVSGTSVGNVAASLKAAMLLLLGDMFENREVIMTGHNRFDNPTVDNLIFPFRIIRP